MTDICKNFATLQTSVSQEKRILLPQFQNQAKLIKAKPKISCSLFFKATVPQDGEVLSICIFFLTCVYFPGVGAEEERGGEMNEWVSEGRERAQVGSEKLSEESEQKSARNE